MKKIIAAMFMMVCVSCSPAHADVLSYCDAVKNLSETVMKRKNAGHSKFHQYELVKGKEFDYVYIGIVNRAYSADTEDPLLFGLREGIKCLKSEGDYL